jgi:hypothetical protein
VKKKCDRNNPRFNTVDLLISVHHTQLGQRRSVALQNMSNRTAAQRGAAKCVQQNCGAAWRCKICPAELRRRASVMNITNIRNLTNPSARMRDVHHAFSQLKPTAF